MTKKISKASKGYPTLSFYDLRAKRKFKTNDYEYKIKKGRGKTKMKFAVATAPSGCPSYRIIGKA